MIYNWDSPLRVLGSNDFAQKDQVFSIFSPFWGLQGPENPPMKRLDDDCPMQLSKGYKTARNINPSSLWWNILQPSQAPSTTPNTSMTHHSLVPRRWRTLMRSLRQHFSRATKSPATSTLHLSGEIFYRPRRSPTGVQYWSECILDLAML